MRERRHAALRLRARDDAHHVEVVVIDVMPSGSDRLNETSVGVKLARAAVPRAAAGLDLRRRRRWLQGPPAALVRHWHGDAN